MIYKVKLTPNEFLLAGQAAINKRYLKIINPMDWLDREENKETVFDNEVNGAMAELAWSKLHGIYWSGMSYITGPDTSKGEVRWTYRFDTGGLPIYKRDKDSSLYILADGYYPIIRFIGMIWGWEARKNKVMKDKLPVCPREKLHELKIKERYDE